MSLRYYNAGRALLWLPLHWQIREIFREVYYCIYKSGCDHESVTHQNAKIEYITVFQGELELVVENRSYIVKSGEAIEFDATLPHRYINKGKTDVIAQAILSY